VFISRWDLGVCILDQNDTHIKNVLVNEEPNEFMLELQTQVRTMKQDVSIKVQKFLRRALGIKALAHSILNYF
jgi:hypothetical protein